MSRLILGNIFAANGSVNFYMFHGGTNFGFMNGANILGYNGIINNNKVKKLGKKKRPQLGSNQRPFG